MVYIGVDPGSDLSAFAELKGEHIGNWGKVPNQEVLALIPFWTHATLIMEGLQCYGMPVGETTFQTAIWLGRFIQRAEEFKISWRLVKRSDVKRHLCGAKAKLKDKDVRMALIKIFGEPGNKKQPGATYGITGDVWSALGIAYYGQNCPT